MKDIKVDVELTAQDIYAFSMRHTYTGFSGIFGVLISLSCLGICVVRFSTLDTMVRIALVVIGMLFTVVQPVMLYTKARAQVKQNENINAKLHYVLDAEGITVEQGEQSAQVKWYDVRKSICGKRHTYLYMSPVRAFIFPVHCCGEKYQEIQSLLKAEMEKYKNYDPEEEKEA